MYSGCVFSLQIKLTALGSTQSIFCTPGCPLGVRAALCSVARCWHLLPLETIKLFTPPFPDAQSKTMPCDFYSRFMKPILFSQPFLLNVCGIGAVFELGAIRASGGGYRKRTGCTESLSGKALLFLWIHQEQFQTIILPCCTSGTKRKCWRSQPAAHVYPWMRANIATSKAFFSYVENLK